MIDEKISDEERNAFIAYSSLFTLRKVMIAAYGFEAVEKGEYRENGSMIKLDTPSEQEILRLYDAYQRIKYGKN